MALDIPVNLFPTTTSQSSQSSTSGINWSLPFIQELLPSLSASAKKIPEIAQALPGFLQGQYNSMMRQALGPNAFQGTLNDLAKRGLINSNVASNTMSNLTKNIMGAIANKGWQSQLAGQQAMMNVPNILAQLAQLGQQTQSGSTSYSYQANPLAPYELMAQLLMSKQSA